MKNINQLILYIYSNNFNNHLKYNLNKYTRNKC